MKDAIILVIKGMIIGIGQIIPGVSGGMLAITLGLYEKGISAISNIFKDFRSNLKFLCSVGIGIVISVIIFSKIIKLSLIKFYLPTMLLFIGLILGGVPMLIKKVKSFRSNSKINILITSIVFIFITLLSLINFSNNNDFSNSNILTYISFFIIGVIYAATMVIPGVSGTAIMMLLGYYEIVINMISNLSNIRITLSNLSTVLPFGFGLVFGIIFISKLMDFLLNKYEIKTYYAILGLVFSSILVMFIQTFKNYYDIINIIVGLLLLILGYIVSKKLDRE